MSEPYRIFVLIPESVNQENAVYDTHEIIEEFGGYVDNEGCWLILEDIGDEEYEPEYLENPEQAKQALMRLAKWPTHGSICYFIEMILITVSYRGEPDSHTINTIEISLLPRTYEDNEDILKPIFTSLAEKLHQRFSAKRTIMDWSPECQGFVLEDEIKRLQNNEFIGEYEILDIRGNSN
jgi:hypothetical protein